MHEEDEGAASSSAHTGPLNVRRARALWIGLVVYFLITLNAFQYAGRIPYQVFVIGALLNVAILLSFVVALTRVYKRVAK